MSKLLLLFLLIGLTVGVAYAQEEETTEAKEETTEANEETCEDLKNQADACAKGALLDFLTKDLPNSVEKATDKCAEYKKNLICAKKYRNKCVTRLRGTMLNIGLRNGVKMHKKYCQSTEAKEDFVRHVDCLRGDDSPKVLEVIKGVQVVQNYIADIEDDANLLPSYCCAIYHLTKIMDDEFELCRNKISDETVDYFKDEYKKTTKEMSDLFCLKFDCEEECNNRYSQIYSHIRNITVMPVEYDIYNNSFFDPMFRMADRMSSA